MRFVLAAAAFAAFVAIWLVAGGLLAGPAAPPGIPKTVPWPGREKDWELAKSMPHCIKEGIWSEDADDWVIEPFIGNNSSKTQIQGPMLEAGFGARVAGMIFGGEDDIFVASGSSIGRVDKAGNYRYVAGVPGCAGFRDGPAERALFASINVMIKGPAGQVYILDRGNYCIRELKKVAGRWQVSTLAGTPEKSDKKHTDAPALKAGFGDPCNLAMNSKGELFTFDNNIIRKIAGGMVSTVQVAAGVKFDLIMGAECCFDDKDNLFVADRWKHAVRKVNVETGEVTDMIGVAGKPVTGAPDGPALQAGFYDSPGYVLFDPLRQCLYTNGVDEPYVRRYKDGVIKTVFGHRNGKWAFGPGRGANIAGGTHVTEVDASGDLYVLQRDFLGVRKARYAGANPPAAAGKGRAR